MSTEDLQPSKIHDIAAAELRQIFIDAVLFGFDPKILADKAEMSVGVEGLNRQAYACEILEYTVKSRQPSIAAAKADKMDLDFGAALQLHWPKIEALIKIEGPIVHDLKEVAAMIADSTLKSNAPAVKRGPVLVRPDAEIVQLGVRRPLRFQFQMAANMLDDFDIEEYHLAGLVERENKLLTLAEDMALEIHSDKMPTDELKQIIHRQLNIGFNSLYFIGNHKPAPDHVVDNFDVTKATIIDALSSRAEVLGLRI